jgi:predicted dehydrogenase
VTDGLERGVHIYIEAPIAITVSRRAAEVNRLGTRS